MPVSGNQLAQLLATPQPSSVNLPTTPPTLSPEQTTHLVHLVDYFSPTTAGDTKSPHLPLTPSEQLFLSRETLLRFLTATKNDLPATLSRLDKCLAWRRTLEVDRVRESAAHVAPEAVCGKEFVLGFSKRGQPVLHFLPNRSDTKESERQLKHVVYMLERTADLMPPGVINLLLIIDFAGKKSAPTSPGMARQFITILQDFYPERLGCAVLLSIPWIVRKFLDIAFTFVDPVTKAKVRWHVDVVKEGLVAGDEALREYGGNVDFVYKQEDYWPLLLSTALAKREQYLANWERLGGGVGVSEWEFKQPVPTMTAAGSASTQQPPQMSQTMEGTAADSHMNSQPAQPTTTTTPTINHLTAPSPLTITSTTPTTAAGTPPSSTTTTTTTTTTSRTESISSESTFHENHGLDMQALEKGMSGGMVIAEGDGIPAAVGVHTGQGNEHGFAGVGVVGV